MDFNHRTAEDKFYRLFFLGILAISIFLRLPYVFIERLWPDEALYAWNAKKIFHHPEAVFSKEVIDFHPPLFSALMSIGHFFFSPQIACHVMVFLFNIFGIIVIYCLGKKIKGRFLGCFAALMLGFNHLYFEVSTCILIDGVLTAVMVLFFYLLTTISPERITSRDFYLGFGVVALLFLKWSGGLVLPFLGLYYLLAFPDLTFRHKLIKSGVPLILAGMSLVILLIYNHQVLGSWVPKVFTHSQDYYREPFLYYWNHLIASVIDYPMIPVFIFGSWAVLKSGDRNVWMHGLWVIVAFLIISTMSSKDMRFMLPLLPSIVLITGFGAETILSKLENKPPGRMIRPLFLVGVSIYVIFFYHPANERSIVLKANTYVGYEEAGSYVKEKAAQTPQAMIMASSPRMIRYYTDINFKEFGGNISGIPFDQSEFVDRVQKATSDIIVVIDRWEWDQPRWIYPLTKDNIKFLKGLGFQLEKTVFKDVFNERNEMNEEQVLWVLRRPISP